MLVYIDPGSGSIILQILIAGATALLFAIATFKNKIKKLFIDFFNFIAKLFNK